MVTKKRGMNILLVLALLALGIVPAFSVVAQDSLIESVCLVTDVGKINDGTFNQLAYEGMVQVVDDYGLDSTYIETLAATDYAANIQTCLDSGYDVIVTIGFLMTDATLTAANDPANSGVYFIGIDQGYETIPANLVGVQYREDQSGFVAGALAALMSETGKIAGIYGIPVPAVVKFRNGYEQGAKYINPDINVQGVYIDSFVDSAKGAETATQLIEADPENPVDVIFGAGGQTGSGGIKAAAEAGVYVIGVDQDEYFTTFGNGTTPGSEFLISSATKRVDRGLYVPIEQLVNGDASAFGTIEVLSAANDGVSFAPAHDSDVTEDVTTQLEEILASLKDGSIVTGVDPVSGEMLPSLVDVVAGNPELSVLAGAWTDAGIELEPGVAYTIFAPNQAAFAAVTLPADSPDAVRDILMAHVFEGATAASEVELPEGVSIVTGDIPFSQGVIHIIDGVLMP
jgi:basic membrane protein A and related proteins